MRDIFYPDSYKKEIVLINDGTYIMCEDGNETICGEAYLLKDGKITQVCENGTSIRYGEKSYE